MIQLNSFNPVTGNLIGHGQLIKVRDRNIWIKALDNDLERLAQGVGTIMRKGKNKTFFVYLSKVSNNKKSV